VELLHVVVVEPVVADGHDPPSLGSSKIHHHICAPSVAARVDGAVDHLSCVSGNPTLAPCEAERHHHGIESCNNLFERQVSGLIAGRRHLVMMVDEAWISAPDIRTTLIAFVGRRPTATVVALERNAVRRMRD
jgi:hypothetical protein